MNGSSQASPGAQRLARVLAGAATLSMPLISVLRDRLAPETGVAELAEILASGLLQEISRADGMEQPILRYRPGTREILQRGTTAFEDWDTYAAVSRYLEDRQRIGGPLGTLIPDATGPAVLDSDDEPFAALHETLATRLGLRPTPADPEATPPGTEPTAAQETVRGTGTQPTEPADEPPREVIKHGRPTRAYEFVMLSEGADGHLRLSTRQLFPLDAAHGYRAGPFHVRCEPADDGGVIFAVVIRDGEDSPQDTPEADRFRLVTAKRAVLEPGDYLAPST